MPEWKQSATIALGIVLASVALGVLGSFGFRGSLNQQVAHLPSAGTTHLIAQR